MYDYVYENVVNETPLQTPSKWSYGEQGEIVIARNPQRAVKPVEEPPELQQTAADPVARIRRSPEKENAPPLASKATEARDPSRESAPELLATNQKLSREKKTSALRTGILIIGIIALAACLPVVFILGQKLLGGTPGSQAPTLAANSPGLVQPPATAFDDQPTAVGVPGIFNPATLTPTPTPPVAANLTNNREGGYDKLSLLFDAQGLLHLTFFSRIPRRGDYYHQQMTQDGTWSAAEGLTAGFDYLWTGPVQARSPQGYICILWNGVSQLEGDGYFKRCQNGPGGSFSPAETWWSPSNYDFSPVILPDGSVQAAFNKGHKITFNDHILSDELAAAIYPHLVMDTTGGYHLVWFRSGNPYSLEYSYSNDRGATWSPVQRLTSEEDVPEGLDLEADPQGNLHLIWDGFRPGVYHRHWTPGQGWSETVKIDSRHCGVGLATNAEGLARAALHCWDGVFFLEQLPDGAWLPAYQISNAGGGLRIDIAVDARDRSHIAWVANDDIFYAAVDARGPGSVSP